MRYYLLIIIGCIKKLERTQSTRKSSQLNHYLRRMRKYGLVGASVPLEMSFEDSNVYSRPSASFFLMSAGPVVQV